MRRAIAYGDVKPDDSRDYDWCEHITKSPCGRMFDEIVLFHIPYKEEYVAYVRDLLARLSGDLSLNRIRVVDCDAYYDRLLFMYEEGK